MNKLLYISCLGLYLHIFFQSKNDTTENFIFFNNYSAICSIANSTILQQKKSPNDYPLLLLSGVNNKKISKKEISKNPVITNTVSGYVMVAFTFIITNPVNPDEKNAVGSIKCSIESRGWKLEKQILDCIQSSKKNSKILIDQIKIKGSDGIDRLMPPMIYMISD